MKVFISWSGARSKAVAELLDDWIRCVLQVVKPWVSTRDVDRGSLWFSEICDNLQEGTIGIVCLTRENKERPWILFEAGALARGLASQRVMTFLVDLQAADISDPLAQFNHTLPTFEGLKSLIATINYRLNDEAISEKTLDNVYSTYWPQFEKQFERIMATTPDAAGVPDRTPESKIDEVLSYVRGMERRLGMLESPQGSNERPGHIWFGMGPALPTEPSLSPEDETRQLHNRLRAQIALFRKSGRNDDEIRDLLRRQNISPLRIGAAFRSLEAS